MGGEGCHCGWWEDNVAVAANGAPHSSKDVRDVFRGTSLNCNRRRLCFPLSNVVVGGDIHGFLAFNQDEDLIDIRPFTKSCIDVSQVFSMVLTKV